MNPIVQLLVFGMAALAISIIYISATAAILNNPPIKIRQVTTLLLPIIIGIVFCVYLSFQGPVPQILSGFWSVLVLVLGTAGMVYCLLRVGKQTK